MSSRRTRATSSDAHSRATRPTFSKSRAVSVDTGAMKKQSDNKSGIIADLRSTFFTTLEDVQETRASRASSMSEASAEFLAFYGGVYQEEEGDSG